MKQKKKSPLKGKPLRYVGQSLDERISELINENAVPYIVLCVFFICASINEWWRYFRNPPPSPLLISIFSVAVILFSVYKIHTILKKVKNIKLGRDGERAVGQYLEILREQGHRVFHDLLGDSFNIDHVIVSMKGIFLIETKTYSKPLKEKALINFDGEKLSITSVGTQTKPIIQVKASSKWLKDILMETTGRIFPIKPVILFPGWWIETTANGKKSDIWVLEPKALPKFIENQPNIISKEDMMLASFHISRYIRTKEANKFKED